MKTIRYQNKEHRKYLKKWLSARKLSLSLLKDIPSSGWIVFYQDEPICAGFVRKFERCSIGLMDSYLTDPEKESTIRDQALNELTETILRECHSLGFEKLLAHSIEPHILIRAKRFGWMEMPGQWLGISLSEGK